MLVNSSMVNITGMYGNKDRYYSRDTGCYYDGTPYKDDAPSIFAAYSKPDEGQFLYDASVQTGYFVLEVIEDCEFSRVRFYSVVLLPTRNTVSVYRHCTGKDSTGSFEYHKEIIADEVAAILNHPSCSPVGNKRHSFLMQNRYGARVGDSVCCLGSSYTIVNVTPSKYTGLICVEMIDI